MNSSIPGKSTSSEILQALSSACSIVVLTGAGVSAESGVPTFRGKDGLWNNFRAEELATPHAFARDPELVWKWYDWRRGIIAGCEPNPAHHAIAELEKEVREKKGFLLVTQNVDGLHRRAGSEKVVELHGNIWQVRCIREGTTREDQEVPLSSIPPPCERCGGLLRPDVVWFGESLDPGIIQQAWAAAESCDLMLVVGTSAVVHPAASLPLVAKQNDALVIEVNIQPTPLTRLADLSLYGKAGDILPPLLDHRS